MRLSPELEAKILAADGVTVRTAGSRECSRWHGAVAAFVPMELPSLANVRWHWRKLAGVKLLQKNATKVQLARVAFKPAMPVVVTLTRLAPRKLDDDNLASAFKAVRDAVAEWLGVDDGSDQYQWVYRQAKNSQPMAWIHVSSTDTEGK